MTFELKRRPESITLEEMIKLAEDAGFVGTIHFTDKHCRVTLDSEDGELYFNGGDKDLPTAFRAALISAGVLK